MSIRFVKELILKEVYMKIKSEEKGKVSHKRNSSLGIVIVSITLKIYAENLKEIYNYYVLILRN